MDFYTRQESLGLDTDKTILVIGAGGIGFNVVLQLAMAGVKKIIVCDNDIIEQHNLNRLPVPASFLGKNKAQTVSQFVDQMRPDGDVEIEYHPFTFNPDTINLSEVDNIIDCTDVHSAQLENQSVASENGISYVKAGYNGFSISLSNRVAEWDTGDTPDGYTITPSYCVPAITIASLVVHKVLTNSTKELACTVNDLFGN